MKQTLLIRRLIAVFLFLSLYGLPNVNSAQAKVEFMRLNEIKELENGYLQRESGDPFIIFPELEQPNCSTKGIQFSISFEPALTKPVLLELFWSTDYLGFGEENKVFFILHPKNQGEPNRFIVPLYHTAIFTQIRLDFPRSFGPSFKIDEYKIVSLDTTPDGIELMDAYYNLSVKETLQPDILIPYLLTAIKHGPQRLLHDKSFLFIWVFFIAGLLYLIRKFAVKVHVQ